MSRDAAVTRDATAEATPLGATRDVVPFELDIPDEQIADLHERLRRVRLPEPEPVPDWSQDRRTFGAVEEKKRRSPGDRERAAPPEPARCKSHHRQHCDQSARHAKKCEAPRLGNVSPAPPEEEQRGHRLVSGEERRGRFPRQIPPARVDRRQESRQRREGKQHFDPEPAGPMLRPDAQAVPGDAGEKESLPRRRERAIARPKSVDEEDEGSPGIPRNPTGVRLAVRARPQPIVDQHDGQKGNASRDKNTDPGVGLQAFGDPGPAELPPMPHGECGEEQHREAPRGRGRPRQSGEVIAGETMDGCRRQKAQRVNRHRPHAQDVRGCGQHGCRQRKHRD